jgi:hypothetical protein
MEIETYRNYKDREIEELWRNYKDSEIEEL